MKKKLVSILLAGTLLLSALTGCGGAGDTGSSSSADNSGDTSSSATSSEEYKFGKIDIPALDG